MICDNDVRQFCSEDPSRIQNYEQAMADKKQTWHCHHRLGRGLTTGRLKELGLYYNRPASELILLTPREHCLLHGSPQYFQFKPVGRYDYKTEELIEIYENPVIAACRINGNKNYIIRCCNGVSLSHFGYKWKWIQ